MLKDKLLPVSILFLAISIVIGSIFISKAIESNGYNISSGLSQGANTINGAINNTVVSNDYDKEKKNMNFQEASDYLRISESELMTLVNDKELRIPHLKIEGRYIFNKEALDKWISEPKANP